ncbi:TetR/AcrR family transcriptional regulator [Nocardia cyriacigeorgica]|uniref:TetR/AcrR family transcriptional regulator n=1 Tax=Nocardia cyriacigeorgica TaxID=135487 RepID=UPI0018953FC7|nr:TetR/AcrR family transcriptional regulator [Nocardia cyriacigeorgica]MBF6285643.1 TetR/AcrR family transcriptional regulator [Nocardia cyriacigeorgica]
MPRAGKRIKGTACERAEARERLRTELLAAARSIATENGGYDSVTVRSVADRVGYTVPIVYQYFANKGALLLELVDAGFTDLAAQLGAALCPDAQSEHGGPLPAVAAAYWDFAMADPHLYRLMHTLPGVAFGSAETPDSARACFEVLRTVVSDGAPQLCAVTYDEYAAADLLWAHLHGLVGLVLDGRIKGGADRGRHLLVDLTGLFAASGQPPTD